MSSLRTRHQTVSDDATWLSGKDKTPIRHCKCAGTTLVCCSCIVKVVNVLAMLTVWCVAPAAQHLPIRLIGTVLGHETQIVHALQQRLKPSITVDIARAGDSLRPAAATLLFHRVKPRLPADEIHSLLTSLQGGLCVAEVMNEDAIRACTH